MAQQTITTDKSILSINRHKSRPITALLYASLSSTIVSVLFNYVGFVFGAAAFMPLFTFFGTAIGITLGAMLGPFLLNKFFNNSKENTKDVKNKKILVAIAGVFGAFIGASFGTLFAPFWGTLLGAIAGLIIASTLQASNLNNQKLDKNIYDNLSKQMLLFSSLLFFTFLGLSLGNFLLPGLGLALGLVGGIIFGATSFYFIHKYLKKQPQYKGFGLVRSAMIITGTTVGLQLGTFLSTVIPFSPIAIICLGMGAAAGYFLSPLLAKALPEATLEDRTTKSKNYVNIAAFSSIFGMFVGRKIGLIIAPLISIHGTALAFGILALTTFVCAALAFTLAAAIQYKLDNHKLNDDYQKLNQRESSRHSLYNENPLSSSSNKHKLILNPKDNNLFNFNPKHNVKKIPPSQLEEDTSNNSRSTIKEYI